MIKTNVVRSRPGLLTLFLAMSLGLSPWTAKLPALAQTQSDKPTLDTETVRCKSIVGSWQLVDDQSGASFLATYNGGPFKGTVNVTSPNTATSLTHGVWRRTGPCTFADTDIAFIYDENGNAAFKIKFRGEIELSRDGDTGVFRFEFEVSLLDGTVVNSGASTATGTRIKVEPRSLS